MRSVGPYAANVPNRGFRPKQRAQARKWLLFVFQEVRLSEFTQINLSARLAFQ